MLNSAGISTIQKKSGSLKIVINGSSIKIKKKIITCPVRKQQNIVNKEHQRSWTLICCLYVRVPPVPIGEKNDFAASGPNVTAK